MKYWVTILAAAMMLSTPGLSGAEAKSKTDGCPPGLAKKNPPCVPPGQAKKRDYDHDHDHSDGYHYHRGDRYYSDDRLSDYDRRRYGLPRLRRGESYYRVGDSFLRVDNETREVLDLLAALGRVLN